MRITLSVAALAMLVGTTAHGDDTLPTLTLQADASGNGAKLKAGFDLQYGVPFSWIVSPFLQATTNNGITNIITIDSKKVSGSASWDMGVMISRLRWPSKESAEAEGGRILRTVPDDRGGRIRGLPQAVRESEAGGPGRWVLQGAYERS